MQIIDKHNLINHEALALREIVHAIVDQSTYVEIVANNSEIKGVEGTHEVYDVFVNTLREGEDPPFDIDAAERSLFDCVEHHLCATLDEALAVLSSVIESRRTSMLCL